MSIEALIRYIESHGFKARRMYGPRIEALAIWTNPANGMSGETWESIAPTWEAVREWLGY